MFLFGDRGLPASLRCQNGYGNHTYQFTKEDGSYHYVKIHLLSNQGVRTMTNAEAAAMAGTSPDAHATDLYDAIAAGDYPSWDVAVQTIQPSAVPTSSPNIFDMTRVWPHSDYPLRKVGRLVIDQNPENYHVEIEQAAFSPSNMVKGIAPSADPMLQTRMFAYPDAARYRLGANYQFLPTNAPKVSVYCPTQRDGSMNFTGDYGGDPNYLGSKLKPLRFKSTTSGSWKENKQNEDSKRQILDASPVSFTSDTTAEDFVQARNLWKIMCKQKGASDRFVDNLVAHVGDVTHLWLREEVYGTLQPSFYAPSIVV